MLVIHINIIIILMINILIFIYITITSSWTLKTLDLELIQLLEFMH